MKEIDFTENQTKIVRQIELDAYEKGKTRGITIGLMFSIMMMLTIYFVVKYWKYINYLI